MALRNAGIVFLNASYRYLGCSITRQNHLFWLEKAHEVNLPFLTKAKLSYFAARRSGSDGWPE